MNKIILKVKYIFIVISSDFTKLVKKDISNYINNINLNEKLF